MRKKGRLRPLDAGMYDSYTDAELRAAFEGQVFGSASAMDVPLLRETLWAMDDRADAEAAPHAQLVWQQLMRRIQRASKPCLLGLTRRGFAVLVAALILLTAAAALAIAHWSAIERIFHLETTQGPLASWTLEQKQSVVDALADGGYDMSGLADTGSMDAAAREKAITDWLAKQFAGEVGAGHYNLMIHLKGLFDGWPLTDKAWYDGLRLEAGMIEVGEFVSTVPKRGQREADIVLSLADAEMRAAYENTDLDPDTLIPYLFYGYIYPDDDTLYWRVHYRDEWGDNYFTVLVQDTDPATYEAAVTYRSPTPSEMEAQIAENSRSAQELQQHIQRQEEERGRMITWTPDQQAEVFPEMYGVPGPEDVSQAQAHEIARDAYCAAMNISREEGEKLYAYSFFVIQEAFGVPHYSVCFFRDLEAAQAMPGAVLVSHTGEVLEVQLQSNG